MKKISVALLCIAIIFCFSACKIFILPNQTAKLNYEYMNIVIHKDLTEQESNTVINIINGSSLYNDMPACGFNDKICIEIEGKKYAIACDNCSIMKDVSTGMYFYPTEENMKIIRNIFISYGAKIPCV